MKDEPRDAGQAIGANGNLRCLPEYYAGCLLGGAVGDALGGSQTPGGPLVPSLQNGGISSHTQLTLFTAEGLLRARVKAEELSLPMSALLVVYNAYQRWLATRDGIYDERLFDSLGNGWLIRLPELYRAGTSDMVSQQALASGLLGHPDRPINDSAGCGGVARVAPVGLFFRSEAVFRLLGEDGVDGTVFDLGCRLAAMTHGHPEAFLPAGCQALLVARLIAGDDLPEALARAVTELAKQPRHQRCLSLLVEARAAALQDQPLALETDGELSGAEALATALNCAWRAGRDFTRGLSLTLRGCDVRACGVLTGQLLGALLGRQAIDAAWLEKLELHEVIAQVAADLYVGFEPSSAWRENYPGW
jgi:ADP-ribosylglycohydrolase